MPTTLQNFYKATVSVEWSTGIGNFSVSVAPTPTSGWIVISPNNANLREIVRYTAVGSDSNGPFVTVAERGVGGTTEQTHEIGEPVRMNITAEHWEQFNAETQDALDQMTDDIANISVAAGNVKASAVVYGNTKLSVAPVSADDPIAVGINDPIIIPEWRYYNKLTFSNEATTKSFTSLPVHSFYKMVIKLNNTAVNNLSTYFRVNSKNSVGDYNYYTLQNTSIAQITSSNGVLSDKYIITLPASERSSVFGEVIIECVSNDSKKQVFANISGGSIVSNLIAFNTGQILNDSSNLSLIDFTSENAVTGTVELWYKDSK